MRDSCSESRLFFCRDDENHERQREKKKKKDADAVFFEHTQPTHPHCSRVKIELQKVQKKKNKKDKESFTGPHWLKLTKDSMCVDR